MPDDPKPDDKGDKPDDKGGGKPTGDALGEAGKRALAEERAARKEADKARAAAEARLKELEDKDKGEVQKAADRAAAAEKRAEEAEAKALRLEVATAKGLTPAQAKRLQGASREELEADADDLLETFGKPAGGAGDDDPKRPPGGKPTERLEGGKDPTETPAELDPKKLAAGVSRGY